MQTLPIRIHQSPKEAPNYNGGDFKPAKLTRAEIVKNGTVSGNTTVDLLFEITDPETGESTDLAIAMTTGAIIQMLAGAIRGADNQDNSEGQD